MRPRVEGFTRAHTQKDRARLRVNRIRAYNIQSDEDDNIPLMTLPPPHRYAPEVSHWAMTLGNPLTVRYHIPPTTTTTTARLGGTDVLCRRSVPKVMQWNPGSRTVGRQEYRYYIIVIVMIIIMIITVPNEITPIIYYYYYATCLTWLDFDYCSTLQCVPPRKTGRHRTFARLVFVVYRLLLFSLRSYRSSRNAALLFLLFIKR